MRGGRYLQGEIDEIVEWWRVGGERRNVVACLAHDFNRSPGAIGWIFRWAEVLARGGDFPVRYHNRVRRQVRESLRMFGILPADAHAGGAPAGGAA